jgi:hypothetical protein
MPIKSKSLKLAGWVALITSAGFLVTAPIFLAIIWMQKEGIWESVSGVNGSYKSGGELYILALPALLFSFYLRKKSRFKDRLSATGSELKPLVSGGFGIAGMLFFAFVMNLNWFYAHETISFMTGLAVMWCLIFGMVAGHSQASKKS